MEIRMNRYLLLCVIMGACAAMQAQQTSPSDPYQGTSNPPKDDIITTSAPQAPLVLPKPSPAHPAVSQPAPPDSQYQPRAQSDSAQPDSAPQQQMIVRSAFAAPEDGTDNGIVQIAPDSADPVLNRRTPAYDPDGDIVHPAPLAPGEIGEGTTIRVRLLERLSTTLNQSGDPFRSRVASDVVQGGQVLIPAGSEIDGRVLNVSTGSLGGHGSMRLNPETVILPDGSHCRLYAQVTGTPGSSTRVGGEGAINPGSQLKRDGIEYGGGVGVGVVAGAAIAGPVGALTGSLVGAGLVTVHLLVSHPQAHLEEGTVLLFTLTEPLHLVAATDRN